MSATELVDILKAFDASTLTRAAAVEAMVARGELREYAEETLALHTGESKGDVIE